MRNEKALILSPILDAKMHVKKLSAKVRLFWQISPNKNKTMK